MDGWQVGQAFEFIRALRVLLGQMTSRLSWIERHYVAGHTSRACAMRSEANTLRQDIQEAQSLVERLERRYVGQDAAGMVPRGAAVRRARGAFDVRMGRKRAERSAGRRIPSAEGLFTEITTSV